MKNRLIAFFLVISFALPSFGQVSAPPIRLYWLNAVRVARADSLGNVTGNFLAKDVAVEESGSRLKVTIEGKKSYFSLANFRASSNSPYSLASPSAAVTAWEGSFPAGGGGGGGSTTDAGALISGTLNELRLPSTVLRTNNSATLPASRISGVISTANLGTGTASGATVLYGDGTWKTAPSGGGGATDFSGLSGKATPAQIGTGTPTAGYYVDGGTGVWTQLPSGGGSSMSIATQAEAIAATDNTKAMTPQRTGQAILSYLPLPTSVNIVFDGNSVVYGTGSTHTISNSDDFTGNNFPSVTMATLATNFPGVTFTKKNFGVSGAVTTDLAYDAPVQTDTLYSASFGRNIVVFRGASNELANDVPVTTVYNTTVAYCQARRSQGWKVLLLNLTPRSSTTGLAAGLTLAEYNSRKDQFNALVKKNWTSFADGIVDVASIGGNLTYADGIHTNDAGYAQIASLVVTEITRLIRVGYTPASLQSPPAAVSPTPPASLTATTLLVVNGTGANGSTDIRDGSVYTMPIQNFGVTVSTTQAHHGGSSLYFNGASALEVPPSNAYVLGTGAFTMEAWIYPTALASSGSTPLIARATSTKSTTSTAANTQWSMSIKSGGNGGQLSVAAANGSTLTTAIPNSSGAIALNTWTHIAIVANAAGTERRIYVNGVLGGTTATVPNMETYTNGLPLKLGRYSGAPSFFTGYAHFRISRAELYTTDFTPPTTF